jgi:hypothetical protein
MKPILIIAAIIIICSLIAEVVINSSSSVNSNSSTATTIPLDSNSPKYETFITQMGIVNQNVQSGEQHLAEFKNEVSLAPGSVSTLNSLTEAEKSFLSAGEDAHKIQKSPEQFGKAVAYQDEMIDKFLEAIAEYQKAIDDYGVVNNGVFLAEMTTAIASDKQANHLQDNLNFELSQILSTR